MRLPDNCQACGLFGLDRTLLSATLPGPSFPDSSILAFLLFCLRAIFCGAGIGEPLRADYRPVRCGDIRCIRNRQELGYGNFSYRPDRPGRTVPDSLRCRLAPTRSV